MEKPATWVYFIQEGTDGPIKIGFTAANPHGRLAALQTGNAKPLRVVTWTPGTQDDERRLHERFKHLRMQGEWFRPERDLVDFVQGVAWVNRGAQQPEQTVAILPSGLTYEDLLDIKDFVEVTRMVESAAVRLQDLRQREAPLRDREVASLTALCGQLENAAENENNAAQMAAGSSAAASVAALIREEIHRLSHAIDGEVERLVCGLDREDLQDVCDFVEAHRAHSTAIELLAEENAAVGAAVGALAAQTEDVAMTLRSLGCGGGDGVSLYGRDSLRLAFRKLEECINRLRSRGSAKPEAN